MSMPENLNAQQAARIFSTYKDVETIKEAKKTMTVELQLEKAFVSKAISKEEYLEAYDAFDKLIKGKTGVYANTWQNRKLGRVGQKYGSEGKKELASGKDQKSMPSTTSDVRNMLSQFGIKKEHIHRIYNDKNKAGTRRTFKVELKNQAKSLTDPHVTILGSSKDVDKNKVAQIKQHLQSNLGLPSQDVYVGWNDIVFVVPQVSSKDIEAKSGTKPTGKKLSSKVESYDWGNLVQVEDGNSWRAVLHPEHQEEIHALESGAKTTFTDEQGETWTVEKVSDNTFNIKGTGDKRGHFEMKAEKYGAKNLKKSETIEIDKNTVSKVLDGFDIIKGGKRAQIGEKRTFGGREYIKTTSGWKYHGKGTGTKAKAHAAGADSKEKPKKRRAYIKPLDKTLLKSVQKKDLSSPKAVNEHLKLLDSNWEISTNDKHPFTKNSKGEIEFTLATGNAHAFFNKDSAIDYFTRAGYIVKNVEDISGGYAGYNKIVLARPESERELLKHMKEHSAYSKHKDAAPFVIWSSEAFRKPMLQKTWGAFSDTWNERTFLFSNVEDLPSGSLDRHIRTVENNKGNFYFELDNLVLEQTSKDSYSMTIVKRGYDGYADRKMPISKDDVLRVLKTLKAYQSRNVQKSDNTVSKALDAQHLLEKGKRAEIGEERTHGGRKMKKTANGWVPVSSGRKAGKEEEESDKKGKKQEEEKKGPVDVDGSHVENLKEQFVRAKSAYNTYTDPNEKRKKVAQDLQNIYEQLVTAGAIKEGEPFWKDDLKEENFEEMHNAELNATYKDTFDTNSTAGITRDEMIEALRTGKAVEKDDPIEVTGNEDIDALLSQFPDDAEKWRDATDEIKDVAHIVRQTYNEMELDAVEGNEGYIESLNFREFKKPADWNKGAKKQIKELWSKLSPKNQDIALDKLRSRGLI